MHPLSICYVVKIIRLHCLCSLSVVIKFKKFVIISEEYLKNLLKGVHHFHCTLFAPSFLGTKRTLVVPLC